MNGGVPDIRISARQTFGIDIDLEVPAFSAPSEHVPPVDDSYRFDPTTTLAILVGFTHNRRVLIQGYHGTGKSTHIEQVAARLNWPCVRVNLDSHISRIDLVGKDAIVIRDGMQVTEFREGMLPWAFQSPTAIVFDEYDAGRPDVMFVIQRVLESEGRMTLLDQSKVLHPHPSFPAVRDREHHRAGGHDRALPRDPADQPGADGPLEHRDHVELPRPRRRGRHRAGQGPRLRFRGQARHDPFDGQARGPDPLGIHERRHLHRHEPPARSSPGPRTRRFSVATSGFPFD